MFIMNTINLAITYRPVHVGWCIRVGNLEDLRRAISWSCTLWGGRFNPIIPVGDGIDGKALASRFRIDVLYPVVEDVAVKAFVDSVDHLGWTPFPAPGPFFRDFGSQIESPFLDVSSSIQYAYDKYVKGQPHPATNAVLFKWDATDPLRDVFLAQFGSYPSPEESGLDYFDFAKRALGAMELQIPLDGALPADAFEKLTPSGMTNTELVSDTSKSDDGFYVGDAKSFHDVVNFWNLRAADLNLVFFDPGHATRLGELRHRYVQAIRAGDGSPRRFPRLVAVWSQTGASLPTGAEFGTAAVHGEVTNYQIPFAAPLRQSPPRSVLANLSDFRGRSVVALQLPEKPFQTDGVFFERHVVIGVRPNQFGAGLGQTFGTLFLPKLNDFYRRQMLIGLEAFRAQRDGFGIIARATDSDVSFRAVQAEDLIVKIFELFGITARPSPPGRIARRTIQQMGGLHGCRLFKLPGVRQLIEKYGPLKSFTRGAATECIFRGRPDSHAAEFPTLFVDGSKLTPNSAFDYLLAKGVFRAGLELVCPNCGLQFWIPLETLGHEVNCDYCGEKFKVAPQLKDRDWRFRRSGLFGRDNHQEGAIPVCLTLQQIESNVQGLFGMRIFGTSFELSSAGAGIPTCETDLVLLMQDSSGQVELAVGECKSSGPKSFISADDARNLGSVADVVSANGVTAFVIFSKTSPFGEEEVKNCELAQPVQSPRVIMLSDRELEPYYAFERTAKEFAIRPTANSLRNLASATSSIYFQPRRTKQ